MPNAAAAAAAAVACGVHQAGLSSMVPPSTSRKSTWTPLHASPVRTVPAHHVYGRDRRHLAICAAECCSRLRAVSTYIYTYYLAFHRDSTETERGRGARIFRLVVRVRAHHLRAHHWTTPTSSSAVALATSPRNPHRLPSSPTTRLSDESPPSGPRGRRTQSYSSYVRRCCAHVCMSNRVSGRAYFVEDAFSGGCRRA